MKDLINSKKFLVGVMIGITLAILFNIFLLPNVKATSDCLSNMDFGFPLMFYQLCQIEVDGGGSIARILWLNLIGNLLFTALISFLAGLSLSFLTDKEPKLN